MNRVNQQRKRYRPVKEAITKRCPGCGTRFYIERVDQSSCYLCLVAQDKAQRPQNYIDEQQGRVSLGCVTSDARGLSNALDAWKKDGGSEVTTVCMPSETLTHAREPKRSDGIQGTHGSTDSTPGWDKCIQGMPSDTGPAYVITAKNEILG